MGAYLMFRVPKEDAVAFNEFVGGLPEQQELAKIDRGIYAHDEQDMQWAKQEGNSYAQHHFQNNIGKGSWKASGIGADEGRVIDRTYTELFELATSIFEKANSNFNLKYYSGSCALRTDYFSSAQLRRITRCGDALSSKPETNRKTVMESLFDDYDPAEDDAMSLMPSWLARQFALKKNESDVYSGTVLAHYMLASYDFLATGFDAKEKILYGYGSFTGLHSHEAEYGSVFLDELTSLRLTALQLRVERETWSFTHGLTVNEWLQKY